MKHIILNALFFYSLSFLPLQAEEFCDASLFNAPKLNFIVKQEEPKIISIDTSAMKQMGQNSPKNPKGMTAFKFSLDIKNMNFYQKPMGKKVCIYPKSMDILFSLKDFFVFMDEKYPKDSCPYQVILEHESIHVEVNKKALNFFAPSVYEELQKAVPHLPAGLITSVSQAKDYAKAIGKVFQDETKDVLAFIQDKTKEKNNLIDSTENYQVQTSRCKNW